MDWNVVGDWLWQTRLDLNRVAPLWTFTAVAVAFLVYLRRSQTDIEAIRQKTRADNQRAWWSRVQWAIEESLSNDERRTATGMTAIEQMQGSELATSADQSLLEAMAFGIAQEALDVPEEDGSIVETVASDQSVSDNESIERGLTNHG